MLFVRPRDPERETWTGRRAGVEGAMTAYGADAAYPIDSSTQDRRRTSATASACIYALGRDAVFNQPRARLGAAVAAAAAAQREAGRPRVLDAAELVHEMRLLKTPEELACMRRAIAIAAEAHCAAMRTVRPGMYEYEIEALLEYTFRRARRGAVRRIRRSSPPAPTPPSSTTRRNDQRMRDDELLLIDAGAEYGGYCADITRTFPVGPRFDAAQRAVYDVVLGGAACGDRRGAPGRAVRRAAPARRRVLVDGLLASAS